PYLRELIFKYEILELCTALKPALLDHLFRVRGEEQLVYLDPDILVFRPLAELRPALRTSDIVVTPHFLSPIPLDGRRPTELPLAFFHFSGVDLKARQFRPSYQDRTVARPGSPIAELLNMYADLLEENGLSTCSGWEYPFSRFDNGVAYSAVFRDLYASLDLKEKERFGDILQTRRPDS